MCEFMAHIVRFLRFWRRTRCLLGTAWRHTAWRHTRQEQLHSDAMQHGIGFGNIRWDGPRPASPILPPKALIMTK
jgi:hypothetical protein